MAADEAQLAWSLAADPSLRRTMSGECRKARYVVMRTSADVFGSSAYQDPVEFDDLDKAVEFAAGLTLEDYRRLGTSWGCDCGYLWDVFETPSEPKKCLWSGRAYIDGLQARGDDQPQPEDGRPRRVLVTLQTNPQDLPETMAAHARELGPINSESYLVIVLEADQSWRGASVFAFLKDAKRHAAKAAAESQANPPIAMVFDAQYRLVYDARQQGHSPSEDLRDCPKGHGPLRAWSGKLRCWECGWPEKQ